MGTNSILDNLDSKDMISNIKLQIGENLSKDKAFLVVEGVDDKKFFKSLTQNNVVICESYSGKKGIEEILEYFKDNKRVLGVRDKDYERRILDERIFFYDFCNIEMMLINDNEVFEKICCEYYNGDKEYCLLKNDILENLEILSELRQINEVEKIMLNFNGIDFFTIVNKNNIIDEEKLYENLKNINKTKNIDSLKSKIKKDNSKNYKKLLNITNGHDFFKLFCIYCKRSKKIDIKEKTISEMARCAFGRDKFKKTTLYNNLKLYQSKNSIVII